MSFARCRKHKAHGYHPSALRGYLPRLGATLAFASLFGFFWINGPLPYGDNVLGLEFEQTAFSRPKLIHADPAIRQKQFGVLENREESGTGFRLLGLGKRPVQHWGLIADPHNNPAMDITIGQRMLEHVNYNKSGHETTKLKPAVDLYYVEISSGGLPKQLYLENAGGVTQHIKGYAGPITLGVTIDLNGQINSVRHVSSKETGSYLETIQKSGYYQQFTGLFLDESHEIDALSGATLSTVAMARSVSALIKKSADSPLALYIDKDPHGFAVDARLSSSWMLHITVLALLFLFSWQRWIKRNRKRVTFAALFGIAYIGIFLNNSFTFTSLLHPFMGVSLSFLMGIYAALALLSTIWDNNGYCKYVCPYGNVQRLITRLIPSARRTFPLPDRWLQRLRLIFTIVLISGIFAGLRQWSSFELIPDFFGIDFVSHWFWISAALVFLSAVFPMIWCRLLCPTGAVLDTLSMLVRPRSRATPKASCNQPDDTKTSLDQIQPIGYRRE